MVNDGSYVMKPPNRHRNTYLHCLQLGGIILKIITTNRRYHQRLCWEAWHINSAHAPLNREDGGLLPDAYLHQVRKKRPLISDHIKGPLVAAFRSPLMKALDRSVETLGL